METKSDRRSFVKLSAAAGTALALGGALSPTDIEAQGSQEEVVYFRTVGPVAVPLQGGGIGFIQVNRQGVAAGIAAVASTAFADPMGFM